MIIMYHSLSVGSTEENWNTGAVRIKTEFWEGMRQWYVVCERVSSSEHLVA